MFPQIGWLWNFQITWQDRSLVVLQKVIRDAIPPTSGFWVMTGNKLPKNFLRVAKWSPSRTFAIFDVEWWNFGYEVTIRFARNNLSEIGQLLMAAEIQRPQVGLIFCIHRILSAVLPPNGGSHSYQILHVGRADHVLQLLSFGHPSISNNKGARAESLPNFQKSQISDQLRAKP